MQQRDVSVSIDHVARAAGVSPATVSRTLNGRPGVREDVRIRVQSVADRLAYRPNRAAKHLAGGRTAIIGLVVGSHQLAGDPYSTALIQSVARAAGEADEGLMLILDDAQPKKTVRDLVSDGLVEGIIISAIAVGKRWVEELLDARMPTVLVGSHPQRIDVPVVDVESYESSARMVGHMLDSGCRRIGIVTGMLDRVDAALRRDGYDEAHRRRGLEPDPDLVFEGDFTYNSGRRPADRLFDLGVDAVYAASDLMAMAILDRALERGIDVPGDLSIAGFDGFTQEVPARMRLSTVEQPIGELGQLAVTTLVDLIAGVRVPGHQVLEPRVILGSTTRPDVKVAASYPPGGC